jgi:hypoxanthine phosphoribosyltransferase
MKRIKNQLNHSFDWIIGIANGGIIPALYLCYELKTNALDTLCLSFYDDEEKRETFTIKEKDYSHIKQKNILLVDDLVDSGVTLIKAISYLKEFSPALIETATVYKKASSTMEPDYYIFDAPYDKWIIFPWMEESTYSSIEGQFK